MDVKSSESVAPTEKNSVPSENELNASMPEDFKKDFFKHKERMKAAEARAKELEDQIKSFQLSEEERKGNLSKVIDELKEQNRVLSKSVKEKDFKFAKGNIKSAIKQYAVSQGCKDAEAFTRLLGEDKLDIVSLDDDFNPSGEDIKMIVDEGIKKFEHIGLFGKSVNLVDSVPNSKPVSMPPKTIKQMSKEELEEQLLEKFK
jgi:hypothetical protein